MSRLFIIDQSLCSPGGHHFDYVNCVARAAQEDQLETFVATNRRFNVARCAPKSRSQSASQYELTVGERQDGVLYENAKVIPSFRNTTYQKVSWLAGLRHLKRATSLGSNIESAAGGKQSILQRVLHKGRSHSFKKNRRKIIAQFAADCSRFFASVLDGGEFQKGDHIFLTTVSELELMGLAIYLYNNPSTCNATWHLQFHFNLFDGRTPEFDSQSEIQRKVRGCFLAALSRVPDHDLNFFCTSEELVEQYSRLTVVDFYRLPYPVNQRFAPRRQTGNVAQLSTVSALSFSGEARTDFTNESSESPTIPKLAQPSGPVRLVVPGELRREKGSVKHLQNVVDNLWSDYLSSGRLQVAVQRPKRKLFRKEKLKLQLPDSQNLIGGDPVIDYMRHPLSESDYCDFIRGADFGLLLHDSRAYYSRRAGVLGELLSCGKPVIVPAGCWLAHQLQESQFKYIDSIAKQLPHSRTVGLRGLKFDAANAPLSGGVVSFDRQRHPFVAECSKEASENIVIVGFDWQHPLTRGVDVRIKCTEVRSDGSRESTTQVVGHRNTPGKCQAIFRVDFGGSKVCFEIENAFDDSTANIRNLSVDFFEATEPEHVPLGSFGLIYPDVESISSSVAEMVEHLDHFRFRAEQYSARWWNSHDPRRTLKYLVGESKAGLKVA